MALLDVAAPDAPDANYSARFRRSDMVCSPQLDDPRVAQTTGGLADSYKEEPTVAEPTALDPRRSTKRPANDAPTTLYRAFGPEGQLLYVGIARNWGRRWAQHSERAPWFANVARLDLELLPDRDSAARAELAAIADERPIHNIRGVQGPSRRTTVAEPAKDPSDRLSLAEGSLDPSSLVGSFFLSGPEPGWQGCVIAEPSPGVYLVELFSWFMGDSSNQHLIALPRMVDEEWRFYDTAQWMRDDYEHKVSRLWEHARKDADSTT